MSDYRQFEGQQEGPERQDNLNSPEGCYPPQQGAAPPEGTPQNGGYRYGQDPGYQAPYGGYSYNQNQYGQYPQDSTPSYGYKKPAQPADAKKGEEYRWDFEEYSVPGDGAASKPKKKNRGLKVFAALMCGIFALGVIGFAGYGVYSMAMGGEIQDSGPLDSLGGEGEGIPSEPENNAQLILHNKPASSKPLAEPSATGELSAVEIAEKVRPSIVGIVTYAPTNGFGSSGNSALPFQASGLGSGIIMSEDGYIITNAHVIEGAYGVKVILDNEDEYEAEIVGSDSKTDLAVIKINASNLTYAEFGDSSELKQGETVYVFGNPYGLSLANSMTKGIVSAINRQLKGDSYTINSIQTDAAINPGNSGGALVNEFGQVVGINSAKIAETDYEGIGFAIPISEAKPIIDELIQYGYVTGRVKLGVQVVPIDETLAKYNNIPTGIMLVGIDEDSSFVGSNVAVGDVIVEVNGTAVADTEVLAGLLKEFDPGDQVKVRLYRRQQNGIEKYFEVTVPLVEDRGA